MNHIFRYISDMFFLLRPTLMIPVWTILMLGWITGSNTKLFSNIPQSDDKPILILFVAFTMQVGYIYILNQIKDVDGDRINGKLFILPEKHISIKFASIYAGLLSLSSLVIGYLYLDKISLIILFLAMILGLLYSLSPFNFKDRPWLGLLSNWLGHGVLTYFAGWYGANYGADTDLILKGLLFSLSAGFANGAVYLASTISDLDGDKEVGKITFAVKYGAINSMKLGAILVTFSAGLAFLIPYHNWVMLIPAFSSTALFWSFVYKPNVDRVFAAFRWPVVFLSAVTTVYVPLYAILVIGVILLSRVYYKKRFNLSYPNFGNEE